MEFNDPIERRKWLAKLVANAKGHARKADRPFELRIPGEVARESAMMSPSIPI